MPLRDFFHRPMSDECERSSVHGTWISTILRQLNRAVLSPPFVARSFVHLGSQIEEDVSALERQGSPPLFETSNGDSGGLATATYPKVYTPSAPPLSDDVEFTEPDLYEVRIYRGPGSWKVVAAIELVSESNKDRDKHRRTFAIKCASYLQKGVSIVVVDTVTCRSADLHNDLCDLLDLPSGMRWAGSTGLQAVAYRVVKTGERIHLDAWPHALAVGELLPTVPLWLASDLAVPLDLELTYTDACQDLLIQ